MAITRDTNIAATTGGAATSLTFSHTCAVGASLFVGVYANTTDTITGVTYAGVSMTKVGTAFSAGGRYQYLFFLGAPSSGANNVIISSSASTAIISVSASYLGGNRTSNVVDSSNTQANASGTTLNPATITVADNSWTVMWGYNESGAFAAGAGTSIVNNTDTARVFFDSNAAVTPAGSKTLTGTFGGSAISAGVIASLAPSTARYWVGGTANWDAATTTHWSFTSGGAGGAPVPTSSDNVFFDANSGGGTVTVTATANCLNLDYTGSPATTFTGSSALNVYGSFTLVSNITFSYSGALTFKAVSTGKTITTASKTFTGTVTFNGSGGGWTLQDNITSSSTFTLTAGTLALSTMTLTFSGSGTPWTATGGTITPGTSTIKYTDATASTKTFAGGSLTYYNLWLTGSGSGAYTISGSNTFNDFKVDTPPHTVNFTAATRQTVTSFTVNGTAGNLMTLQSTSSGTQWKLASNSTISCDYLSLKDSRAEHV